MQFSSFFLHSMSLNMDMRMIRSLKFSSLLFFLSKSIWISRRIVNVVNPGNCPLIFKNQKKQGLITNRERWPVATRKLGQLLASRKLVQTLSVLFQTRASIHTRKVIARNETKWITIHANPKRGSDLAIFVSKTVTTMWRHYDQDERESDGSRHWEAIKSVFLRTFARNGARDFSDEVWLQKIFEGSSKKRTEYCKNKDEILCYLRAIQGHSGGIPIEPELMGYVKKSSKLEEIHIPQRTFMELSVHIGKGTDSRRKGERQSPSSSLSNTNESFWRWPGGREASWWFHRLQKAPHVTKWKFDQDAVYWDTIIKGAGSRIGILAHEVICNHGLHYNTWRLYWSCDCSGRRSSDFRKAWNSKTDTWGNVEKELAKPAAAAFQTYLAPWKRRQKRSIGLEHKTVRSPPQSWI